MALTSELACAQISAPWLKELPGTAYRAGRVLHVPELLRLAALLRDDLRTMARPLVEGEAASEAGLAGRVNQWCAWLEALTDDTLDDSTRRSTALLMASATEAISSRIPIEISRLIPNSRAS